MRRTTVLLIHVLVAGVSLLGPSRVFAEPFLDVYGGVAETDAASVTAQRRDCPSVGFFPLLSFSCSPWTKATRRVDFEASATYGGRGGYRVVAPPPVGVPAGPSVFRTEGPGST